MQAPSIAGWDRRPQPPPGAVSQLLADLARVAAEPVAPRESFRAGDVVGRFELLGELGRGGFGVVFQARDLELGRRVAVKTVRPGAPLVAARETLQREIDAGRLRHPNIVAVLEAGRCERGPYVVFEHLSGESLGERLARGPLAHAEAIGVALSVTRALAHAHARGVLHRDVKPGNVFLTSTGTVKLIDFGLASIDGSRGPRGSGTSGYMSPEQRRGEREDARTDLFALGVLIHEMAPRMPGALERIAVALVESDPDRRPGSADEVLERLRAIHGGGAS